MTTESHFKQIVKKHKGKCARNALFIALPVTTMIISGPNPINVLMLYFKIKGILKHCTMYIFYKFANDRCARRVRVALANLDDNYQDMRDLEMKYKVSGIKQLFTIFLGDLEAVMVDCLPAGAIVPKDEDLPDPQAVFDTDIEKFDTLQKTEDFWGFESSEVELGDKEFNKEIEAIEEIVGKIEGGYDEEKELSNMPGFVEIDLNEKEVRDTLVYRELKTSANGDQKVQIE